MKELPGLVEDGVAYAAAGIIDFDGTAIAALDVGQPLTLIGEAVFARCLSAIKDERVEASKILSGPVLVAAVVPQMLSNFQC